MKRALKRVHQLANDLAVVLGQLEVLMADFVSDERAMRASPELKKQIGTALAGTQRATVELGKLRKILDTYKDEQETAGP